MLQVFAAFSSLVEDTTVRQTTQGRRLHINSLDCAKKPECPKITQTPEGEGRSPQNEVIAYDK